MHLAAQLHCCHLLMQGPEHELTNGSLADVVYTANIPLLGILASADPRGSRNYVQIAIKAATEVLDRNDTRGLFMRRTVEVSKAQGCKRRGECLHHRGEGTRFICQQGARQGAPVPSSWAARSRREALGVALIAGGAAVMGDFCISCVRAQEGCALQRVQTGRPPLGCSYGLLSG